MEANVGSEPEARDKIYLLQHRGMVRASQAQLMMICVGARLICHLQNLGLLSPTAPRSPLPALGTVVESRRSQPILEALTFKVTHLPHFACDQNTNKAYWDATQVRQCD